ncbi:hypothetical protein [Candidatus Palauibacter sp.]|uniref:hypothetical protein n=1 Tax=Candidatus Palauibacter sp. TaxID=3101350 RepID=UPI003AF2D97A
MSRLLHRTGPAAGFAFVGLLLVCGACGDDTTPDYTAEELAAAKTQLRDHVRLRTSEAGLLFGREWVGRAPDDAELRALYARQLSAWRLSREIREQAELVLGEDPEDPWGLYMETLGHFAANDWEPALESSRRAWEASPRPEFAAAHLRALSRHDYDAAFAFLESLDADTRTTPEVFSERAQLESRLQYDRPGPAWADSSLATYAEMRERWPEYVEGFLHPAEALFGANRSGEALPLIERALALAPGSADVRQWHWTILSQSDVLPVEERRPAVEASLAAFRDAAPETLRGLSMMASAYRDLEDDERASELEALVIEREPRSRHASLVYLREQRAADAELRRVHEAHGEGSPEYRAQLEAVRDAVYRYLERPLYDDTYIGGAYMSLFNALKEMDPVPAEELADAVRGLTAHARGTPPWITYVEAPLALVEHTPHALEAAEIARAGLQASLDYTMSWRDIFDTEGEWEQQVRATLSASYDAMGWAYLSAGRTDDGRHTLERALTLWPENPTALHHMGQLHEQLAAEAAERGDGEESTRRLDEAEDAYIVGLGITTFGENPNRAALESCTRSGTGLPTGSTNTSRPSMNGTESGAASGFWRPAWRPRARTSRSGSPVWTARWSTPANSRGRSRSFISGARGVGRASSRCPNTRSSTNGTGRTPMWR